MLLGSFPVQAQSSPVPSSHADSARAKGWNRPDWTGPASFAELGQPASRKPLASALQCCMCACKYECFALQLSLSVNCVDVCSYCKGQSSTAFRQNWNRQRNVCPISNSGTLYMFVTHVYIYIYMEAVRNCVSKPYEQRQLVEQREWENSSRERPAIGPRKNEIIVNLDAAWCL